MLAHRSDWQSLIYLALAPCLVAWQWLYGLHVLAYAALLFLQIGVCVIHHNHAHRDMWLSTPINRLTDLWLTALQGHPTYVFYATHNDNHHRFNHGIQDAARTYRFGGDTNSLQGYLMHPFYAVWALYPLFLKWLAHKVHKKPPEIQHTWQWAALQYGLITAVWAGLAGLDFQKFLTLVLIPQLFALHWLLAANYLQHAHADGTSNINFARNFEGWVNAAWFNIGFHTAHHLHPQAHWSQLPQLHDSTKHLIDSRLIEKGLLGYMWRTYFLALFSQKHRSKSLMPTTTTHHANSL